MTYAQNTTVSTEKSKAEIEHTLERYGADRFAYGWDQERALIEFAMDERRVRFLLPLPDRDDDEFWFTPTRRRRRDADDALKEWEKACRQRWRALALVVKAKLEAVESGITEFEEEFGMHIVLPNGRTVSQEVLPEVAKAYETGMMPETFLAIGPGD